MIVSFSQKDRFSLLDESLLKVLREQYKEYKSELYLFEGEMGKQYSVTSVVRVVAKAAKKALISRKVTPHMLRHSFATHLLENGIDIRYIQQLLEHNSIKTTQIYTAVSSSMLQKIDSPIKGLL